MEPLVRRGRLIHLDEVPLPELRVLYSHAVATVLPSFYEGFGYSPLESMCCHTPAIASDIAAHRGVYGEAALYCDPYRVSSIVSAIERLSLASEGGLRQELVERGRRRASRYRAPAVAAQWRAAPGTSPPGHHEQRRGCASPGSTTRFGPSRTNRNGERTTPMALPTLQPASCG